MTSLNQLIDSYHSIEKTEASKFGLRISYLRSIEDFLLSYIEGEVGFSGKKFLKNIYKITKDKRLYLQELENLNSKLKIDPKYIETYAYDLSKSTSDKTPIFLSNKRKYDSKLRIYWGEYFLEAIDPCHRFLTSYYDLWLETNPINKDYFSFFVWLEGQNVHFQVTSVQYLTRKEKDQCEAVFKGGKLVNRITSDPLTYSQKGKEYLFIVDLDERLYIVEGSNEIRHPSLSYFKPVLAVGNILVEEGIITRLGLESGHYQPDLSNGRQLLDLLFNRGVTFSQEAMLDFYHDQKRHSLLVADFKSKSFSENSF